MPQEQPTPVDTDASRVDRQPDPPLLSPVDLAAWGGFLRSHDRLMRRLDANLVATHGMALVEYEVLFTLHRAGGSQRMSLLAHDAMLSKSGLTRIVDVLVAQRLVRRRRDAADGRVVVATLTTAGRARMQAARRTHSAQVRRLLLDPLTTEQKIDLGRVWTVVLDRLDRADEADRVPGADVPD